jgi:hypothetical protein
MTALIISEGFMYGGDPFEVGRAGDLMYVKCSGKVKAHQEVFWKTALQFVVSPKCRGGRKLAGTTLCDVSKNHYTFIKLK